MPTVILARKVSPPPTKRTDKLAPLTGFRFFAAMGVVLFHFGLGHIPKNWRLLTNVVIGGAHGVTLFFLLSGFVLAYNYAGPDRAGFSKKEFWISRFARIYPVYALSLLLNLERVHFFRPLTFASIWGTAFPMMMVASLTQSWWVRVAMFWNIPAWTLSVEAFFYLIFPWACVAVCRLKPQRLIPAAVALWLLNVGVGVAYWLLRAPHATDDLDVIMLVLPPVRLPEFLLGVVLGRLYLARPQLRVRHVDTVALISVAATLMIVAVMGRTPLTIAILELPFGILIYALAAGGGVVGRLLSLPLVVLLGEASYAVYILHVPIMRWTFRLLGNYGVVFGIGATLLTVISVCSFLYIETPMRRWIKAKWMTSKSLAARGGA